MGPNNIEQNHNKTTVTEVCMNKEINRSRGNNAVAFAHSISADINCERNMSAGVAVALISTKRQSYVNKLCIPNRSNLWFTHN